MTTNAKTFRLFISSTFNDFKLERQVLHEKVFPIIDNYCIERGYTFQPVDLRWGVNDEAQLDQKTLDLCLNEVRACKHYPYPNFLIMLGNRYGWVSLPYAIEKDEFESILTFHVDNNEAISMLKEWYIEDSNHLIEDSHAYVIKERDPEGAYAEPEAWEKVENKLRALLQDATNVLLKDKPEYRKYFLSATEAEVEEGIFKYLQPTKFQISLEEQFTGISEIDKDYVYGFVRTIKDLEKTDLENEPAKSFIDQDQTNVTAFRKKLIGTLGEPHLLTDTLDDFNDVSNVALATVSLSDQKKKIFTEDSYLKAFELFMVKKLTDAVDKQIQEAQQVSALDQERSEQLRFKSLKTETFFGREEELEQVQDYVNDTTTTQPFMVHGISGIGKSSFIAKGIDQTEELLTHRVAYRFIGATAPSSNIRTLLESLITDLADQGVLELPEAFEENSNKFNAQIKELLSDIEQPVVIVLDALDQLQHKDYMQWLPLELKSNLKIILSMLDQKGYEHYYNLLKNKIGTSNQLEISSIADNVATKILDALLKKEKRTLTPSQKKYVLKQVHASHSSPLYLKIAFEEIKTWKSTETTETLSVGIQEIIKEFIDNLTDRFHHDKNIVHKVLGFISASRDGLSEKEILDLLSRDEEILKHLEKFNDLTLEIDGEKVRRFPISIWARLSEQLKPFLNERLIDGQNLIKFFHRQIDEAVRDYIYEPNKHSLHTELAAYFLTLQDKEKTWDKRYYNLHMLDEYPYHLFHSNNSEKLKEILFNLEFVGSIYDHHKQNSFREILGKASTLDGITQDEIYPWESFYREKEHFITLVEKELCQPHESLFQMAYEDGDNSPLYKTSEQLLELGRIDFKWLKRRNRPHIYTRLGLLGVLLDHWDPEGNVEIVKVKNDTFLSWTASKKDRALYHWNSQGELLGELQHNDSIQCIHILDDSEVFSLSSDGTIRKWSLDGHEESIFKGHTGSIVGVHSLDDKKILSWSSGTLHLWDISGQLLSETEIEYIGTLRVLSSELLLNEGWGWDEDFSSKRKLFHIKYGNDIHVEEAGKNYLETLSENHSSESQSIQREMLTFEDGKTISWSKNKIYIWSNEEVYTKYKNRTIDGISIIDQDRSLSYSENGQLKIWTNNGQLISVIEGNDSPISYVFSSFDGKIFSWTEDGNLHIWSSSGKLLSKCDGYPNRIHGAKTFDAEKILVWRNDTMWLCSFDGDIISTIEEHSADITFVHIQSDGFLTYSRDHMLRRWGFNGELLGEYDDVIDGRKHYATLQNGKIVELYKVKDNTLVYGDIHIMKNTTKIQLYKLIEDDNLLIYFDDGTLQVRDRKGTELNSFYLPQEYIGDCYINHNVLTAHNGVDILLYDFYKGNKKTSLSSMADQYEELLYVDGI